MKWVDVKQIEEEQMSIGVVDLFCGVGGLTYGLQNAGLEVVAGIDLDTSCQFAFESNNDSIFIHKSIDDVKGIEIKRLLRGYDIKVLVGCAPCQPFSRHQKDKSDRTTHKDWGLLYEFLRIVREAKPHVVSMENVPELENEKVFRDFVKGLESLKYKIDYKVVDAADHGVPQRRKRLLLLASKLKKIKLIEGNEDTITVRNAIGNLPAIDAGETSQIDTLHTASALSEINLRRMRNSTPGGTWNDWPDDLKLECHKKKTGKSYSSVYGRMLWDDVSPTITTQFIGYGTGRFGHPEQNRALSLREGAILQSFPENYKFVEKNQAVVKKVIARQIGNAVPPKLGEVIGESIIEHSKKRKNM